MSNLLKPFPMKKKKILFFLVAALLMGATTCGRQVADPSAYQEPNSPRSRPDAVRDGDYNPSTNQRVTGNNTTGSKPVNVVSQQSVADCARWSIKDATFPVEPTPRGATPTYGQFYTDVTKARSKSGPRDFKRSDLAPRMAIYTQGGHLTHDVVYEACVATAYHVSWSQTNREEYTREQKNQVYQAGDNLYVCIQAINRLPEAQELTECEASSLRNIQAGFQSTFDHNLFAPQNLRTGNFVNRDEIKRRIDILLADPKAFLWYEYPGSAQQK
jgi:hypothetical protein